MIGTEQERAALMALIQEYAADYGRNEIARLTRVNGDRYQLRMYETRDRIRAMLASDDAVGIPRALAERAAENLEISANEFRLVDMMDAANDRQTDAEVLRAVLRGEATRDENA